MIDPTNPTVAAMAEGLAREGLAAWEAVEREVKGQSFLTSERIAARQGLGFESEVAAQTRLLTNFARPPTRDIWVRWWWNNCEGSVVELRDNPSALEAAVVAALETT